MIRKYHKKTLQITGLKEFNTLLFLRRLQKSSIKASLTIFLDTKTRIFLSVFDETIIRKSKVNRKFDLIQKIIDGCDLRESDLPSLEDDYSIIHVIGTPLVAERQLEALVAKLLEIKVKSIIFTNLTPINIQNIDCPFRTSFSIAVTGKNENEIKDNVSTATTLVDSLYDKNSIKIVLDKRPKKSLRKLLRGEHPFSSILDLPHVMPYFDIPLTYGIEPLKTMDFPIPNKPFSGILLGQPAEFSIEEIKWIKLDPNRLFEHMALWGASGTGKTTLIKNLLVNLEKSGVNFCVIDWHNEYRNIVSRMNGKIGKDVIILNPMLGSLSLNPLELFIGETKREIAVWERIENFISLLHQMFSLGEIQEARIRKSLSTIYSENDNPTISELSAKLQGRKMKTLAMKLEKFTKGFYGEIFNRKHSSIPFKELKSKNVIIELGQIPTEVRTFFTCVFIILWWDNLRLSGLAPNVLILDDFYRYSELNVIRKMLSEARKFRQGLICSHQGPYQLPEGVREEVVRNTATKIIFRQEQTWDKYIVRDALGGLKKEQLEALSYLEIGQAIIKHPSCKSPLRMNTFPPPETRTIDDNSVTKAMENSISSEKQVIAEKPKDNLEKRFLREIKNNPDSPLTKITKSLKIKTQRGYNLRDQLIKKGYLEKEKIKHGRGRPRIHLKLTKKAFDYLDSEQKKTAPQYGKTEHLHIKKKIESELKGWNTEIENGCDLTAQKDGYLVAIEVETGKTHDKKQVTYNVRRDSDWADLIVIVCPNKKSRLEIEKLIKDETRTETKVITYRQIKKIKDIIRPRLTMRLLNQFWRQYSIAGKLSRTGVRKLSLNCFNMKNSEKLKERMDYSGEPKFPFWEQSIRVQAQILAILKTHPEGEKIAKNIEDATSQLKKE